MSDKATALSFRNVSFRYLDRSKKSRYALEDLTFDLKHREILGVIGRNGSGKSTLLRLLAGIYEPSAGEIQTYDNKASLLSLKLGFMNYLTARENIVLSSMLHGLSRKQSLANVDRVLEFAELEKHADDKVHTFSSGMVSRLGFSIAYYIDPDILLIDEVLGVGDLDFRAKSRAAMVEKINAQKAVVLVSHQLNTIRALCQTVMWLEAGRIKQLGPCEEVLTAYRQSSRAIAQQNAAALDQEDAED
ncbi:MAG: ABC transporter ATP-binding protein [Pseudomonadales bacterium]